MQGIDCQCLCMRCRSYLWAISGLATLFTLPDFVEVVLVELSYEAGKIAMLEVFWKNVFSKLLILHGS